MDKFYLNNVQVQINDMIKSLEMSEQITDSMAAEINMWRERFLTKTMPDAVGLEEIEAMAKTWRKFLAIPSNRMVKESPVELMNSCLKYAKEDI